MRWQSMFRMCYSKRALSHSFAGLRIVCIALEGCTRLERPFIDSKSSSELQPYLYLAACCVPVAYTLNVFVEKIVHERKITVAT